MFNLGCITVSCIHEEAPQQIAELPTFISKADRISKEIDGLKKELKSLYKRSSEVREEWETIGESTTPLATSNLSLDSRRAQQLLSLVSDKSCELHSLRLSTASRTRSSSRTHPPLPPEWFSWPMQCMCMNISLNAGMGNNTEIQRKTVREFWGVGVGVAYNSDRHRSQSVVVGYSGEINVIYTIETNGPQSYINLALASCRLHTHIYIKHTIHNSYTVIASHQPFHMNMYNIIVVYI